MEIVLIIAEGRKEDNRNSASRKNHNFLDLLLQRRLVKELTNKIVTYVCLTKKNSITRKQIKYIT